MWGGGLVDSWSEVLFAALFYMHACFYMCACFSCRHSYKWIEVAVIKVVQKLVFWFYSMKVMTMVGRFIDAASRTTEVDFWQTLKCYMNTWLVLFFCLPHFLLPLFHIITYIWTMLHEIQWMLCLDQCTCYLYFYCLVHVVSVKHGLHTLLPVFSPTGLWYSLHSWCRAVF